MKIIGNRSRDDEQREQYAQHDTGVWRVKIIGTDLGTTNSASSTTLEFGA